MGSIGGPHRGYNRNAYPYSLPPNFTLPTMHENMDHAIPTTFEGQLPQPIWGAREEPREHAQLAVDLYPPFTIKGSAFHAMPHPNIVGTFQPRPIQPHHFSVGGPPSAAVRKGKLDLIEERLRLIEGSGDYPFADMTDLCLVSDVVIPPKFKVSDFDRFKGTICPKNHLKMYC